VWPVDGREAAWRNPAPESHKPVGRVARGFRVPDHASRPAKQAAIDGPRPSAFVLFVQEVLSCPLWLIVFVRFVVSFAIARQRVLS
jgi:hypothetical protein